jgi:hypothetical protein
LSQKTSIAGDEEEVVLMLMRFSLAARSRLASGHAVEPASIH